MGVDLGGPAEDDPTELERARDRDATAVTIGRVAMQGVLPAVRVVRHHAWTGRSHWDTFEDVVALAETWRIRQVVGDATGLGGPVAEALARRLGRDDLDRTLEGIGIDDLGGLTKGHRPLPSSVVIAEPRTPSLRRPSAAARDELEVAVRACVLHAAERRPPRRARALCRSRAPRRTSPLDAPRSPRPCAGEQLLPDEAPPRAVAHGRCNRLVEHWIGRGPPRQDRQRRRRVTSAR